MSWEIGSLNAGGELVEIGLTTAQPCEERQGIEGYCLRENLDWSGEEYFGLNAWIGELTSHATTSWGRFSREAGQKGCGLRRSRRAYDGQVTWRDLLTCVMNELMDLTPRDHPTDQNPRGVFWTKKHWSGLMAKNIDHKWTDNTNPQTALLMLVCIILGFQQQMTKARNPNRQQYNELCQEVNDLLMIEEDVWSSLYKDARWSWDYNSKQCRKGTESTHCQYAAMSLLLSVYMSMRKCCSTCQSYDISGWLIGDKGTIKRAKQLRYNEGGQNWIEDAAGNGRLSITGDELGSYISKKKKEASVSGRVQGPKPTTHPQTQPQRRVQKPSIRTAPTAGLAQSKPAAEHGKGPTETGVSSDKNSPKLPLIKQPQSTDDEVLETLRPEAASTIARSHESADISRTESEPKSQLQLEEKDETSLNQEQEGRNQVSANVAEENSPPFQSHTEADDLQGPITQSPIAPKITGGAVGLLGLGVGGYAYWRIFRKSAGGLVSVGRSIWRVGYGRA
ncbi:hypothetical protein C922_05361 [Plasmodium inui San Antonio 1]|uniref:Uncharacterized protein n=1 Tax=Plasmodium inui San Antonio 1 TaxID=1237626 RepID=W7A582_9APIC|nr:hypothetical protein C922_05361 [Plasmodium inui San Antonio 1]EUD64259.1 hypothetical protein C922_05361 [Plasmodium inui San Antonio 1]